MAVKYANLFKTRETHQSQPIPGRTDMTMNSAGGFTFSVDDWKRLRRWLIIGSAGGSYYASEKKLTVENANVVMKCLADDPLRVVREIVEISDAGKAPKNDQCVFALAIAAGFQNPVARKAALDALPKVCRIPTHLMDFLTAVKGFRGFGRGLRNAIGSWFNSKDADQLAYHCVKYMQRNGVANRDLLRLSHPVPATPQHDAIYRWVVGGASALGVREVKRGKNGPTVSYPATADLPPIITAFEEAKAAADYKVVGNRQTVIRLIRDAKLPRECVPTEHLNDPDVWDALLPHMPLTALVRNLGKMTSVGLAKPFSEASKAICAKLGDRDYIRKSRLHPISILVALKTYAQGHGEKGSLRWSPVPTINDALDSSFYMGFDNVEPTGKNTCLALDISGSMGWGATGVPLTPREITAAMAMVMMKTEPNHCIVGYADVIRLIDITKCSRLVDVVNQLSNLPFGGTNCALPFQWAAQHKLPVEVFISYTDNETHGHRPHPCQALTQYREQMGIRAKSAIVAVTATNFTIADPLDPDQVDVCGFSTDVPVVLNEFAKM